MKLLPLLLALALAPAAAEDNAPQSVNVSNVRDPAFKSYRLMLRGFEAFEKHQGLAPKAALRFKLLPGPEVQRSGLELRLAGDSTSIPVPLDDELSFSLPRDDAAAKDDADLRTNRKRGAVRWSPDIRTPGLAPDTRRLGDIRLECLVFWTIGREDTNLLVRTMFSANSNPCDSANASWYDETERPLASAQLREGGRVLPLKLWKKKMGFQAPLRDKSWSDDAVIELRYLSSTQP
ncbi:hypothetical protein [Pseudoduganella sp. OTU4001]|uniref:hypothetical protein n=1 Tax=Pseudoduganella sp. OTU4001 TaxID=3043854 RepID=UPI00313B4296